jgi:predicted ATP-binding protein involved in virulence
MAETSMTILGAGPATVLTALSLTDFRSFTTCRIDFHRRLTVVFGKNGTGKSSIIDAIAIILTTEFANAGARGIKSSGVEGAKSDCRRLPTVLGDTTTYEPSSSQSIQVDGYFGFDAQFAITHQLSARGSSFADLGKQIGRVLEGHEISHLPLFAVFRAVRKYGDASTDLSNSPVSRSDGYRDCLDVSRSRDGLTSWFKRQLLKRGRSGLASTEATAVLEALKTAVPSLASVEYDADLADLVVDFGAGEVPFGSLSDGQRGFFAMIAEIAIRCTQLNPQLNGDAIRQTKGLVLVDEIDLHLHPEWQRQIVRSLVETFPNIQFVVTTHSPVVLTEVEPESVVDLDRPEANFAPELSSFGKDSGWVTREVMDASTRPRWAEDALTAIKAAIRDHDDDEARRLMSSFRIQLGDQLDPELARWEAFVGEAAE